MKDTIYREDAIKAIHNYWKKRLDTLPTKESEYGEVYADIQQIDKILEHNRTLCNFIKAIPSADRPQGEWVLISEVASNLGHKCSNCGEKAKMIVVRSVLVDNYYCNKAEPITEYTHKEQLSKFCPNCGARTKGADDE